MAAERKQEFLEGAASDSDGPEKGRFLDHGTFALQCHNDGSHARFRSVRVRPLPDDIPTPGGPAPPADEVFKQIISQGRHNIPMADFHTLVDGRLVISLPAGKFARLWQRMHWRVVPAHRGIGRLFRVVVHRGIRDSRGGMPG